MLCWPRIRWWWSRNNRRWTVGRPHAGSDGAAPVLWPSLFRPCAPRASCHVGSTETDEEDPIMTIPPELEAQILRYYHVEKWRVGTIARAVARVHPGNRRPCPVGAGCKPTSASRRHSDHRRSIPISPFIRDMLAKFPTLTASRLHVRWLANAAIAAAQSFPCRHRLPSTTSASRALSAAAHAARGTGVMRLRPTSVIW